MAIESRPPRGGSRGGVQGVRTTSWKEFESLFCQIFVFQNNLSISCSLGSAHPPEDDAPIPGKNPGSPPIAMPYIFLYGASDIIYNINKSVHSYLSSSNIVLKVMNSQTQNVISMPLVEPLLMGKRTIHNTKGCDMEYHLIGLGIKQVIACIVAMITVNQNRSCYLVKNQYVS